MTKLEEARKQLRDAENTLARLQGEEGIVSEQLVAAQRKLIDLGIPEEEVEAHLAKLKEEERVLLEELETLDRKISGILARKGVPEESESPESLLATLDL